MRRLTDRIANPRLRELLARCVRMETRSGAKPPAADDIVHAFGLPAAPPPANMVAAPDGGRLVVVVLDDRKSVRDSARPRDFSRLPPAMIDGFGRARRSQAPVLITQERDTSGLHLHEMLFVPARAADGGDIVFAAEAHHDLAGDFLAAIFEASPNAVLAVRPDRDATDRIIDARVISANRHAARLMARLATPGAERRLRALLPGLAEPAIWKRLLRAMLARLPDRFEIDAIEDGATRRLRLHATPFSDGLAFVIEDLTEIIDVRNTLDERTTEWRAASQALAATQNRLEAEVEHGRALERDLAHATRFDQQTKLFNRRAFEQEGQRVLLAAGRYNQPVSLIRFEIDPPREACDQTTNAARIASAVAIFSAETRDGIDIVARLGAQDFAIVLPQTDLAGARAAAERLRQRMTAATTDGIGNLTVSAGVAIWFGNESLSAMLARADEALFRAVRRGRNRVITEQDWPDKCGTCVMPACGPDTCRSMRAASAPSLAPDLPANPAAPDSSNDIACNDVDDCAKQRDDALAILAESDLELRDAPVDEG